MKLKIYWGSLISTCIACALISFCWALHCSAEGYSDVDAGTGSLFIGMFGGLLIYNWLTWGLPQWEDDNSN